MVFLSAVVAPASDVLKVAREFHEGGGYDRSWKSSGVPVDVDFRGHRILTRAEQGSYCCGYTFAVVMRAAEQRGLLDKKSIDQIRTFQKQWYGATDDDKESLCVFASEKLGIGTRIDASDARAGDFLQFWRANGSGHSVVFLDWIVDDGKRIGFQYRSSQAATDGIGDHAEYLVGAPGKEGRVTPERMHFCRLHEPVR